MSKRTSIMDKPLPILYRRRILKWVEALESGKFKQGTEFLHIIDTEQYCCLGVACTLNRKVEGMPHQTERFVGEDWAKVMVEKFGGPRGNSGSLTDEMIQWLGFDRIPGDSIDLANGPVIYKGERTTLVDLNDGNNNFQVKSLTFKQIAKVIRRNFLIGDEA